MKKLIISLTALAIFFVAMIIYLMGGKILTWIIGALIVFFGVHLICEDLIHPKFMRRKSNRTEDHPPRRVNLNDLV